MGLDKFNIAPDNKGGRKPKEKRDEEEFRGVEGEPYIKDHGEDYWRKVWHKFVEGTEAGDQEMAKMARYTSCLPITVKQNLHEYDIAEYPDAMPDLSGGGRFSSSSALDDDSGLAAVINDAK